MMNPNPYKSDFKIDILTEPISKTYKDVPGNLVAFACNLSFQKGGEGFVSFTSKTELIDHYIRTLGAYHIGGRLMIIDDIAARRLIDKFINI